jgi:hypothetical protein
MPLVFMSLFFLVVASRTKWLGGRINAVNMTYLYTVLASLAWRRLTDLHLREMEKLAEAR